MSHPEDDPRARSLDDRILAACLDRYGGDRLTARLYWQLGRVVLLQLTSRRVESVEDAIAYLAKHHTELEPIDTAD